MIRRKADQRPMTRTAWILVALLPVYVGVLTALAAMTHLLPAAPSGQQMRKQNSAPAAWLVCERCLCACSTVGAGHDSVCCEESLDK